MFSYFFILSTMERQFTTRTLTDLFILFFCLVRVFLDEECCCLDLGVEVYYAGERHIAGVGCIKRFIWV